MAGIRLTPDEFADIVIAFLLDASTDEDEVLPDNIEFHYILDKMKRAGLKSQLLSYFIDTSSITRSKYKKIKGSFTGDDKMNTIVITDGDNKEKGRDDKTTIRNIVKSTLKMVRDHKLRKNNGMPLNENVVDKIIDKAFEKEGYDG